MRIIRLSGEIGVDVVAEDIIEQLRDAGGNDLQIDIVSPGGSVFDGIAINNAIIDFQRDNPTNKIIIRIEGIAASMASYICMVPVAKEVLAEENAVFMIHHPWNICIGNLNDMKKNAEFLEGLSVLMAKAYSKKTRKSDKQILEMMDQETWLFGNELKDHGFVDKILESDSSKKPDNKAVAISQAKLHFQKMKNDISIMKPEPDKVAAAMQSVKKGGVSVKIHKITNNGKDQAELAAERALDAALTGDSRGTEKLLVEAIELAEKKDGKDKWFPGQFVTDETEVADFTISRDGSFGRL